MVTTREQIAPFLGRLLLASKTSDPAAFTAVLEDLTTAGGTVVDLLTITTDVLVHNLDVANPGWADEVKLGLLEGASE